MRARIRFLLLFLARSEVRELRFRTVRLTGKVTEADMNELRRMVRSKMYWPKFLLANWYGIALLAIVLWATIAGAAGATKPNWKAVGIIWLVLGVIFAWSFYRARTTSRREFSRLNAGLADWITIANEGITFDGPNGAKSFQPWGSFRSWRPGQRVFLVDRSQDGFVILPVADLSDVQRQSLRQLLDCQFPTLPT